MSIAYSIYNGIISAIKKNFVTIHYPYDGHIALKINTNACHFTEPEMKNFSSIWAPKVKIFHQYALPK